MRRRLGQMQRAVYLVHGRTTHDSADDYWRRRSLLMMEDCGFISCARLRSRSIFSSRVAFLLCIGLMVILRGNLIADTIPVAEKPTSSPNEPRAIEPIQNMEINLPQTIPAGSPVLIRLRATQPIVVSINTALVHSLDRKEPMRIRVQPFFRERLSGVWVGALGGAEM